MISLREIIVALCATMIVVVLRSKTKEAQSWFSKGKQCFFLREIMVFQRKTIIVTLNPFSTFLSDNNYCCCLLFCCFTDSNKRIQTKVFKQKKHNNYCALHNHENEEGKIFGQFNP